VTQLAHEVAREAEGGAHDDRPVHATLARADDAPQPRGSELEGAREPVRELAERIRFARARTLDEAFQLCPRVWIEVVFGPTLGALQKIAHGALSTTDPSAPRPQRCSSLRSRFCHAVFVEQTPVTVRRSFKPSRALRRSVCRTPRSRTPAPRGPFS